MTTAILEKPPAEIAQTQTRTDIAQKIDRLFSEFTHGITEMERKYKYELGHQFRLLRETFDEEREFVAYCRERFPLIQNNVRVEYTAYHKKLTPKLKTSRAVLKVYPPIRHTVQPGYRKGYAEEQYRRIVDKAALDEKLKIERQKAEKEAQLIHKMAVEIVNVGFRVLSVKLHPDKGGSHDAMRRLNQAKKLLIETLSHRIERW
jgi:hypothetical protein